jgi:hypothetical protein
LLEALRQQTASNTGDGCASDRFQQYAFRDRIAWQGVPRVPKIPTIFRKLPVVFVACPYDERRFGFSKFKDRLDRLPWSCIYADTSLQTKHLLETIRNLMRQADFCLFDLSGWNANVALELGLAHGLGKRYFILVNRKLSSDVPSDIKGIQRIEYTHLTKGRGSLRQILCDNFFKIRFQQTKALWRGLAGQADRDLRYVFAMRVLAHLRDNSVIAKETCRALAKKLGLRRGVWEQVCESMWNSWLLARPKEGGYRLLKRRQVFKRPRV